MFLSKPMLGTQLDRSDSLNNPVLDLLFNEGHGNIVNDLSGWGNHVTLHGFDFPSTRNSGWNPGADGVALTFDAIDDYINCGNNPSLDFGTGAFTAAMRFKMNSVAGGQVLFGTQINSNPYYGWMISNYDADKLRFELMSSTADIKVEFAFTDTMIWHDIIGVRDGDTATVYLDGISKSSASGSIGDIPLLDDLLIGGRPDPISSLSNCSISRARILPRAMSAFEVMQTQIDPYGVYLR